MVCFFVVHSICLGGSSMIHQSFDGWKIVLVCWLPVVRSLVDFSGCRFF